jgi:predicted DNA-binding transcriptional regulator AlpA
MSTKYRRRRHRSGRRALTIPQFCRKYRLSRSTYFDLQKRGLGPTEMRITERTIRISPRAEDEWVAKKEAGQSAPVPVFAARSDGGAKEVGEKDHTIARQQKKRHEDESRQLQSVPRNEGASQSAPRSSANRKQRDGLESLPRRQKKRSKRAAPPVPKSPSRDDTNGDAAVPRRRKGSSKNRRQGRSDKSEGRKQTTETQLDIIDLKRRLRTRTRLPKDALIESSRWRLDTNCYRKRDRDNERTMLRALTGPGSSEAEQRQAIEQANCTPGSPCGRLLCWLCKHRTWFRLRRKLPDVLKNGVPHDEISFVTIVIAVCEPSPQALLRPMSKFRSWLAKAADAWNVSFFGRFEIDLLPDPRLDLDSTAFKRKTLQALGLERDRTEPVAVLHVHLIAYHPTQQRCWLSMRLKQCLTEPRRTHVEPFDSTQAQSESLDNLTRYVLKSLPPQGALVENGSTSCRASNRILRLHNKLMSFLDGANGECIATPLDTPKGK